MDNRIEKLQKVAANLSVLLVEDEALIRQQLSQYLERFFKRVVSASDGEEGLQRYRDSGPFDIVLSDIRMPRRDGVEMMRIIKEAHPDQKFIIISAHSDASYFLELIQMGVYHYIIKPINYMQLLEVLIRLAGQLRNEEELNSYKYHLEELVTEQTQELRERLWTDATTQLPNHVKLHEDFKNGTTSSIAMFNMDNFSKFNMSFGLQYGDAVLKKVGAMLKSMLEEGIYLYRYTSDEFVLRAESLSAESMQRKVRQMLERFDTMPLVLMQCRLDVSFTVGIAPCGDKHCIEHARMAIEAIREVGKRRIALYDDVKDYITRKNDTIQWIDEVASGLKEDRFIPFFQPIADNSDGQVVKYECLARLQRENGEIVLPGAFLPAAEHGGFLPEMSRQIIDKSFKVMAGNRYDFSLNMTGHELKEPEFVDYLAERMRHYGIQPQRLSVEVLEGISLQNADLVVGRLNAIKALGCRLSIDDFGTEGSNFSRLMELNADYLKIDGTFIKNLDTDERSRKITRAIVAFAKSIGCRTIAEYVHSESVWHEVRAMGIDFSQGYWVGTPERDMLP